MIRRRQRRPGYTLLEILLALTIAIVLLAALYSAVGYQLRQAQAGRDVTGQTTLSRSIVSRMESDVVSSLALCDPARFRNQALAAQKLAAQSGQAATGAAPTGQAATGQAATGQAATGTTSTAKTTTNTANGGTATPPADAQPAEATDDSNGMAGQLGPVVLPSGVIGDGSSLTLYVTKVPGELYGVRSGEQGQLVSDIRKIHYWLGDGGLGLCRQEVRVATAAEALSLETPGGDTKNYLLAPEVKSMEFRYFDGSGWVDSWDSTALGDDEITPRGAPRAIEVRIGVLQPGGKEGDELKYYRHVIAIVTANGITQASNGGGGTSP